MDINLLAISIGNTRTRLGTFLAGKLGSTQTVDNQGFDSTDNLLVQAYEPLRDQPGATVLLASVNQPVAKQVIRAVRQHLGVEVIVVEKDIHVPIGRQFDPEALIGVDRLLNAAAAYDVLKQACIVVDAGTAITVDFIDGAGTFHGGAIGPGAQMMLDSLHEKTDLLPEVTLAKPQDPIGHNTVEAIRSAVFFGLRGMVRELVEQYAQTAGSFPVVVATGGNAPLLFGDYDLVERVVPDLTLMGMVVTLKAAMSVES